MLDDGADAGPTGQTAQAIAANNGISINGIPNGLAVNGLAVNGIGANGLAVNGIAVNGIAVNGLAVNGIGVNGIGANGIAVNGLAVNGFAVNGIGVNGLYVNGVGANGLYVNGLAVNGIAVNGIAVNGIAVNGLYVNGIAVNGGIAQNGLYVNGVALNGVGLNGIAVNGTTASTALKVGLADGSLGNLTTIAGGQALEFRDRVMPYLAYCALPASTTSRNAAQCATDPGCVSIKDHAGATRYYWGSAGYAPEWKSGPMSATGSDLVEGCLKQACTAAGASCQNGMALNSTQEAQLLTVMKYMVSCALPAPAATPPTTVAACNADPGCAVLYNSAGAAIYNYGLIGLVPSWKTAPLAAASDQEKISACLGSRTNYNAQTVLVSLRSVPMGLVADPMEARRFRRHEGAFYGNLFGAAPTMRTCKAEGGGMAGRVCTGGTCGFVDDGLCSATCTELSADGTYDSCGGRANILNTFLPFQKLAASGNRTQCIVEPDGKPWCWGQSDQGELGNGTIGNWPTQAFPVSNLTSVDQVVSGGDHFCARRSDGTIWCWGENTSGQLGDNSTTNRSTPVQAVATDFHSIVDVSSGDDHTCAIKADGTAWCWGYNAYKQIGDNTTTNRTTPYKLTAPAVASGVVSIATGYEHTCALKADGKVYCWGRNDRGQLGDGTYTHRATPVQVAALGTSTVQIGAGEHLNCALKNDATMWCWGDGWYGIGDGSSGSAGRKTRPVQVRVNATTPLTDVRDMFVYGSHGCAIRTSGDVHCFGWNKYGEIGDNTTVDAHYAVRSINFPTGAVSITSGRGYACARYADKTQWCLGLNMNGQFGDKTWTNSLTRKQTIILQKSTDPQCNYGESTVAHASQCGGAEICHDGWDNDGDLAADCADSGCSASAYCNNP